MARFGQKKTLTDVLYSRPVMAILVVLIIFLLVSVIERYKIAREMSERTDAIKLEKEELIKRKGTLEEKVEYLGGERGLEEEMRTHFDVVKEGEQVIILMGEKETKDTPPAPQPKVPWYHFW